MFETLRSRLLLSYGAVIGTVLVLMGLFLLAFSAVPRRVSLGQDVQRLVRANLAMEREVRRLDGGSGRELERVLREVGREQEVRVLRLSGEGMVVFDVQGGDWVGRALTLLELSYLDRGSLPAGLGRNDGLELGRYVVANQRWLVLVNRQRGGDGRGFLAYALPELTPLGFFRQYFMVPLWQAGLASLLVAAVLSFWVARSIARPLQEMAHAAGAIANENYDQPLVPTGPLEVRTLAGALNRMAARVAQSRTAQRDFVANVSHDLKTPLTSIQGWSQALLDGAAETAGQREKAAGIIHGEAERMARLVNQLLDLERVAAEFALEMRPVAVDDLVAEMVQELTPSAQERGVVLRYEALGAHEPLVCLADGDRLRQLFGNLLENGLKYTPAGGEVVVETAVAADKKMAQIMVRDTGVGIAPAEQARVFERFYQVDRSRSRDAAGRKSAGLGLAIARQLAVAHGGEVRLESEVGRGSSFTVSLPLGSDVPMRPDVREIR